MSWFDRAACKGKTALMFPRNQAEQKRAHKLCGTCPVQYRCLQYVLEFDVELLRRGEHDDCLTSGVWAATSKGQRRVMIQEDWGI